MLEMCAENMWGLYVKCLFLLLYFNHIFFSKFLEGIFKAAQCYKWAVIFDTKGTYAVQNGEPLLYVVTSWGNRENVWKC